MIKLSDEAKKAYAKYVGPDGKLVIDDSLPEDLKETFQFFNDEGINILEMNIDYKPNDDVELLEEDINDDTLSDDDSDDFDVDLADNSSIVEDDSEVDLDSLNNLFG